jgi:fructose-1,6-bisphosphatase/inositol monophosphatase family enzyme
VNKVLAGADWATLEIPVSNAIRRAADTAIMPCFRNLCASAVTEKSPGEVVTIADRKSEELLSQDLSAILSSARVVGEEACSANPQLLQGIDQRLVWIVDPLDGTANFAAGRETFGVIVALACDGVTQASWLYLPVANRMYVAALGRGAKVSEADGNTRKLHISQPAGRPIATLATQFMPEDLRVSVGDSARHHFELKQIPRCAAQHYPSLCEGEYHVALFQRTLPWDHAAGALLLSEAGGHVGRWNGGPYHYHDGGLGILATSSRPLWDQAEAVLLADGRLAAEGHRLFPQQLDSCANRQTLD